MTLPADVPAWATLCLRSAAQHWGIEGVPSPEIVQVTWRGRPRAPEGVDRRHLVLRRADWTVSAQVRVTQPLRTVVDLAHHEDLMVARIAAESAVRQRLVTAWRIGWWLERSPDRGNHRAGLVLAGMNVRAGSVFETHGRVFLESLGVGRVLVQVVWDGHPYDFYLIDVDVFIELQGYQFHSSRRAWRRDLEVVNAAQARGSAVVLLAWEHIVVHPGDGRRMVMAVVQAHSQAAGFTPGRAVVRAA